MATYRIPSSDGTQSSSFTTSATSGDTVTLTAGDTLTIAQGYGIATSQILGAVALTVSLTASGSGIALPAVIDNAGTLAGDSTAHPRPTVAVGGAAAQPLDFINEASGVVTYPSTGVGLSFGSESDTLSNYGTISTGGLPFGAEAISLGAGNDELDLYTGSSVTGALDGGAGSDVLDLNLGGAIRTGTLASVSNFETLDVNAGAWTVTDAQDYSAGITISGVASLTLGQGGSAGSVSGPISDAGTLLADRSDTLVLSQAITGYGQVVQSGSGTTVLSGTNSFSGGATITAGTLEIASPASAGRFDVSFAGSGVLALDGTTLPANTIDGFAAGDAIDLEGVRFSAADTVQAAGGTVTVGAPGASYTLHVSGVNSFALSAAADGSLLLSEAPCYAAGTAIDTPGGPVAVERLRAGDRVSLAEGGSAPVRWVGHRSVDLRRHQRPEMVAPVRVRAGSFGPGLPRRDLVLSPEHALFLDGVLVPAGLLVDGEAVSREWPDRITYHHVELERHAVMLAEGLPAESYLDTGNRDQFANNPLVALQPCFAPDPAQAAACAPLLLQGPALAALRERLRRAPLRRAG